MDLNVFHSFEEFDVRNVPCRGSLHDPDRDVGVAASHRGQGAVHVDVGRLHGQPDSVQFRPDEIMVKILLSILKSIIK